MKVKITPLKKIAFVLASSIIAATFLNASVPARASADDTSALYKTKCFACHGATAEKKFDATMSDAELIQFVLKGKKMEKPPNMPPWDRYLRNSAGISQSRPVDNCGRHAH